MANDNYTFDPARTGDMSYAEAAARFEANDPFDFNAVSAFIKRTYPAPMNIPCQWCKAEFPIHTGEIWVEVLHGYVCRNCKPKFPQPVEFIPGCLLPHGVARG